MASGVGVLDECKTEFELLKIRSAYRYIQYKITDDSKNIGIEKKGDRSEDYDTFKAALPENECRYIVYDVEYELEDGGKRSKVTFIFWSPDVAKIKSKMLYASSKDALRKQLVGVAKEYQATDSAEIAWDSLLAAVKA